LYFIVAAASSHTHTKLDFWLCWQWN